MEYNDAIEELKSAEQLLVAIRSAQRRIKKLWDEIIGSGAVSYGVIPTTAPKSVSEKFDTKAEIEWEVQRLFLEYQQKQLDVQKKINNVGEISMLYANVLTLRYIEGMSYEEIGIEMHYDGGYMRKLKKKAIELYCAVN